MALILLPLSIGVLLFGKVHKDNIHWLLLYIPLCWVVSHTLFVCSGATDNYEWYSADGTLIGRWFGADNITGRGPELWKSVMKELSIVTGSEIALEYKLYESTDEVFEALYNGEIDSACGDYLPSGAWTHTVVESEVARPLAFSAMQCPELMSSTYLFTEGGGPISSLPSLFEAIGNSTESFPICVASKCDC